MVATVRVPRVYQDARRIVPEHRTQRRRLSDTALGEEVRDPGRRWRRGQSARPRGPREVPLSDAQVDCVFCRIAAHTAPATIRYESADLVAFDAEPAAAPLHVLVIPRVHIRSVADLDD